jgi:ankyrin repeat protein
VNAAWDWGAGDWEVPLEAAAHVGRREIARHLLAHGARPSLFASAMLGDHATVGAALTAVPAIANTRGPHGFTLLYHAAISGEVAMAEAIHPHLATPERDCNQALQAAVRDNHPAMTSWLLEHGVTKPNTRDFTGQTPLALAVSKGYSEVAAILRSRGATE